MNFLIVTLNLVFVLMGLALVPTDASAQASLDSLQVGPAIVLEMQNGEEYRGVFQELIDGIIVLATTNGEVRIKAQNVKRISTFDPDSPFTFQNPNETRYFFAPSGMSFNFVNVGVTDHFSISGGLEWSSTLAGLPIWFITPKVGFQVGKKSHVGVGLFIAGFAGEGTAHLGICSIHPRDSREQHNFRSRL